MSGKFIVRRPRSVTVNIGWFHFYFHAVKPRLDSDRIPMRLVEWEVYLGNLMILGDLTFSKVKK